MTERTLIPGVTLTLGGRDFVVPPLSMKAMRELGPRWPEIKDIGEVPTAPQIDLVMSVLHTALMRNYPDLTMEDLDELIDLANLPKALMAAFGASPVAAQILETLHV